MSEEKYDGHLNDLSPYAIELLDILCEELAEVIQRATKMKRFGAEEVQEGQPFDNVDRMSMEIGDLSCVLERLDRIGLINMDVADAAEQRKDVKLRKYMQHQPPGGVG